MSMTLDSMPSILKKETGHVGVNCLKDMNLLSLPLNIKMGIQH